MKKVSIQDIANSLKVSKSTISLVLNGRGDEKRISKETQAKIIKFAKEHNYKANQLARGLSRGKSEMIGLILPNISDNFYSKIAQTIEQKARLHGYTVIYSSSNEDPNREKVLIHSMLDQQVDGLIIASTQQNQSDILLLKKMNFPFVLFDRHYPDIDTNFVIVDSVGGVCRAVEHLVHLGRKRIGFISLKPGLEAMHGRLSGYQQTMEKYALPMEDGFVVELSYDHYATEMTTAVKSLVQFPSRIEGVVFATHYLTASGIRELKKLNVRIPMDVAIVSFDEESSFDLIDPPITSVIQPVEELGDRAVQILLKNLGKDSLEYEHAILKTDFVIRKSCGTL